MEDLMTHRAGFAYGILIGPVVDRVEELYRAEGVLDAVDARDMVGRLATLPLAYQPGSRWRYSLAMDVQGAIIERLSGQSLPELMAQRIFAPLGMTDTAFHVPPEKRDRLASLYYKANDGPLAAIQNPFRADGTYHRHGAAGTWFWVDPVNDLVFVGMIELLSYTAPPLQELTQQAVGKAIEA